MTAGRTGPWALYDALVAGVPPDVHVADALVNRRAVVRTSEGAVGYALVYEGGPPVSPDAWLVRGRPLREVAAYARSWNLRLAALGVAALNAWYAAPARLAGQAGLVRGPAAGFFPRMATRLGARPTAVVGHFRDVDDLAGDITVLERHPRGTDLPDPACEWVLPDCELVVVTGSAVVNKTLPRLLELSAHAAVHLVGPTAPPAPAAYPPCVVEIAGSSVVDPEHFWHLAALGLPRLTSSSAVEAFSLPTRPASTRPATGRGSADSAQSTL